MVHQFHITFIPRNKLTAQVNNSITRTHRLSSIIFCGPGRFQFEPFEGFVVGPGLDRQFGLGAEAHPEDNYGEKAGEITRQLPVLPLPGQPGRRRSTAEGESLGPFLVSLAHPSARCDCSSATGPKGRA